MPPKLTGQERLKIIKQVISTKKSVKEACQQANISRTLFYRWLKRYQKKQTLTPQGHFFQLPPKFRKTKALKRKFSPEERLAMIREVIKDKKPIAYVCLRFGVSRTTLYKWLKRFQQVSDKERLSALEDKKREISRYFRQTPEKYEQVVLSVVAQYPELGIEKIVAVLPKIGNKPIVGYHGVQKILERNQLNTYSQRLAYSESQVTAVTQTIS